MAKLIASRESSSFQKLPEISETHSLVSPTPSSSPSWRSMHTNKWAVNVRKRLDEAISRREDPQEKDIESLIKDLIAIFITALQKDNRASWLCLKESLELCLPYRELFVPTPHLVYYLERIQYHLNVHKDRLFDLQITASIHEVFPQVVHQVKQADGKKHALESYKHPQPPATMASAKTRHQVAKTNLSLPSGTSPFKLRLLTEKDLMPKMITVGELRRSLADVTLEMATRDSIWRACMGSTAMAVAVDLPEEELIPPPLPSARGSVTSEPAPELEAPTDTDDKEPLIEHPKKPMTGREAVEYFTKCYHTGKIKSMYFNIASGPHYRPYDIVAVPENKADREHYVFSTFGVLHVYGDQPSENLSLSDWQREAVLFKAVSVIPFFKTYLPRKMFSRWRQNVKFCQYKHDRGMVARNLLHAVPSYGMALLHISALLQQLPLLTLLKFDNEKSFELGEFESANIFTNIQAEKILERFFGYIKMITNTISEALQKKVAHCEDQVRQKPVFTKDSLTLQRLKKERREENLKIAKQELQRMPTFLSLVERMVFSHVIQLIRTSISTFVDECLMPSAIPVRVSLFKAKLIFSHGKLVMNPSPEKFVRLLQSVVEELLRLFVTAAHREEENDNEQDDTPRQSSPPVSTRQSSVISKLPSQSVGVMTSVSNVSQVQIVGRAEKQQAAAEATKTALQVIQAPHLPAPKKVKKEDDELGQATPRMVLSRQGSADGRLNELLHLIFHDMTVTNLLEQLEKDEFCQNALRKQSTLVNEALEEVDEFLSMNDWLIEIHSFCKNWNSQSITEYKGMAAFNIEQKLNELRQWVERVRNFEKIYLTENGMFYIDCSRVKADLVPTLSAISQEICEFVAEEAATIAKTVCKSLESGLTMLKNKDTTMGGFAAFAEQVVLYNKTVSQHQQDVEYVRSMFEVIRMSYRHLSSDEEKLEERMLVSWERFMLVMQEASDFVNLHTPLIGQDLADTYNINSGAELVLESLDPTAFDPTDNIPELRMLEERAKELFIEANSGKFVDAKQDATSILDEMTTLRNEFYEVERQMAQCSKWRKSILGEPFDTSFMSDMVSQMDVRQELWKFIEVSTHEIKDWKRQLFKKFSAAKVLDKVNEWQAAAAQLRGHLPEADGVLTQWYRSLRDFKEQLPFLHKLSSPFLKERHMKMIFISMGEQYEAEHDFIVEELLSLNLSAHSHMIANVHRAAQSEAQIEQELDKVSKTWQNMDFKLAKHIPNSVYKSEKREQSWRGLQKYRQVRTPVKIKPKLPINTDSLYIIKEFSSMLYMLEDGQVTLQRMLTSPFLSDHRNEAQKWSNSLAEVEQILHIWNTVQINWLYLLKVLEEPEMYLKYEDIGKQFQPLHDKYRELMLVVLDDPKVLSVVTKERGEQGLRTLQGQRLTQYLTELLAAQEEILKQLASVLDDLRCQFPRLYFLSEQELVALLSISRNPTALVPHVTKCFKAITGMTFSLPPDVQGTGTSLDYSLFAHQLEATAVTGALGETVPLCLPLPASENTIKWLATLECHLKSTIEATLKSCIQAQLDGSSAETVKILEELLQCEAKLKSREQELARDIKSRYGHWLLHFPSQCVLVAQAVLWQRAVSKALAAHNRQAISSVSDQLSAKIAQYASVLRENSLMDLSQHDRLRLHILLGNLISQTSYHRDLLDALLQSNTLSLESFDWLSTLRYNMEIQKVAKIKRNTEPSPTTPETEDTATIERTTVQHNYELGKCEVSHLFADFAYDYEFQGTVSQLVATPVTNRARLSMTQALQAFQCVVLTGPSCSGKSAVISDLAQALGRHLVTYNCSEELTLSLMTNVLSGALHSGCWVVWDNVDRLPYGLTSVLGQQLGYVANSLRLLSSTASQYSVRGMPHTAKRKMPSERLAGVRRNTVPTLHPLPADGPSVDQAARQARDLEDFIRIGVRRNSVNEHGSVEGGRESLLTWRQQYLGQLIHNSCLIPASSHYGCFMTLSVQQGNPPELPANIKLVMRPVALITPDIKAILEMKLLCEGFISHENWASKLALFFKVLRVHLPQTADYDFGMTTVLQVVSVAAALMQEEKAMERMQMKARPKSTAEKKKLQKMTVEESSLLRAISCSLAARMANDSDTVTLKNVMRDVFPQSARPKSANMGYPKKLVTAVEDHLKQENLQVSQDLVDKILLLYSALKSGQGVIITGPAGSGKSTCYKILAKTLTSLHFGSDQDLEDRELTPERSLNFLHSQKLKVLKDVKARDKNVDIAKKWQKLSLMTNMLSRSIKTFTSTTEDDDSFKLLYPKVDLQVIFPNVYDLQELYGGYEDGVWKEGLLERQLQDSHTQVEAACEAIKQHKIKAKLGRPTIINKWLVLDGALHSRWMDILSTVLDGNNVLSMANGGHIRTDSSTHLIFETSSLHNASPATLTHCALVCCEMDTVTWKCLWEGWVHHARQKWLLNTAGWQVLTSLANSVFPITLAYLSSECSQALYYGREERQQNKRGPSGVQEVTAFLNILSALMERHLLREDMEKSQISKQVVPQKAVNERLSSVPRRLVRRSTSQLEDYVPNYMAMLKCLFSYAYIWGFGGSLHDSCQKEFSSFAREALSKASQPIKLPEDVSVFDVVVDVKQGTWLTFHERPMEKARPVSLHFNNAPHIERYNYLVDLLLSTQHPTMLTGEAGVGKTALIENLVQSKHPYTKVTVSYGYTSHMLMESICAGIKFQQENKAKPLHLTEKSAQTGNLLYVIDDLSDASGASECQPVLELLRQILSTESLHNSKTRNLIPAKNVNLLVSATTPSSPSNGIQKSIMSKRLCRQFTTLTMYSPDERQLASVYNKVVLSWLEEFPSLALEHHYELSRAIVGGAVEVYNSVKVQFAPTPSRPHHVLSLHNLAHAIEGILLLSPRVKIKPTQSRKLPKISLPNSSSSRELDRASMDSMKPMPPMMRTVARLWCHELCRVFADRFTNTEDIMQFEQTVKEVLKKHFCSSRDPSPFMTTIKEDSVALQADVDEVEKDAEKEITEEIADTTRSNVPSSVTTTQSPALTAQGTYSVATKKIASSKSLTPYGKDDKTDVGSSGLESNLSLKSRADSKVTVKSPQGESSVSVKSVERHSHVMAAVGQESDDSKLQVASDEEEDSDEEHDEDDDAEDEEESTSSMVTSSTDSSLSEDIYIPESLRQKGFNVKPAVKTSSNLSDKYQPPRQSRSQRVGKKGVSFKVGLYSDRETERYYGPLFSMDQILEPGEKVTDVIFSRNIMTAYAEATTGIKADKGYSEVEMKMMLRGLQASIEKYNSDRKNKQELAFFKEAVQHIARLTRVLTMPGGHAVLLGLDHGTGRSTLIRIAAFISNLKMFEIEKGNCEASSRDRLWKEMQACSKSAAFANRQVVLLVKDDLGHGALSDICSFIKEGSCPGLYSADEISTIATMMSPTQVKLTRMDKIDAAFNKFIRKVLKNVHVILCMKSTGGSGSRTLQDIVRACPGFMKLSFSIDVYYPWNHEAYMAVAEKCLLKKERMPVLWNTQHRQEQVKAMVKAMAYIHQSCKLAAEMLYRHQWKQLRYYSPAKFKEFICIFKVIAASIAKNEQESLQKYEAGLSKVKEAMDTVSQYKQQTEKLHKAHQMGLAVVQEHLQIVENQRQHYIKGRDVCKLQEKKIEEMTKPIEQLRAEAQQQLDKVQPLFNAAVTALGCLSSHDLEEVKSFRKPPHHVCKVMEMVCLLFKYKPSWENVKSLMTKSTLYSDMEFYDKENIPDDLFQKLAGFFFDADMAVEKVQKSNKAAASFAKWLNAVYVYADIARTMKPKKVQLQQSERQLAEAQSELGKLRIESNKLKAALESRIQAHSEAVKHAKDTEKSLQAIDKKLKKAMHLLDNINAQSTVWKIKVRQSEERLSSIPGDALLTAAALTYHGCLDHNTRTHLLQDWLTSCQHNKFDFEILSDWQTKLIALSGRGEKPGVRQGLLRHESSELSFKSQTDSLSMHSVDMMSNISSAYPGSSVADLPLVLPVREDTLHKQDPATPMYMKDLLTIRENYSLADILSSFQELSSWRLKRLPEDDHSIHNALIMRTVCHANPSSWPLLVDPDNQAEIWVQALQHSNNFLHPHDLEKDDEEVLGGVGQDGELRALSRLSHNTNETSSMVSSRPATRGETPFMASEMRLALTGNQPVTEKLEVKFLEEREIPDNRLWVVRADDFSLQEKLLTALVYGATVLITNTEAATLPPVLQPVLKKQYYHDKDGVLQVDIGGTELPWHRDFRIYLSTSVNLFFRGSGLVEIPLDNVTVIDMGISQQGVVNMLQLQMLAIEKPEYEGQRYSIMKDIIHYQQQILGEQEKALKKTLELAVPLLKDITMLDMLTQCQHNIQHNSTLLEDTRHLDSQQTDKCVVATAVVTNAADLYSLIKKILVINPTYHVTLEQFTTVIIDNIRLHHRGKGAQGAPKARVQELIHHTTNQVFQFVSTMMSENHSLLFATLIALDHFSTTNRLTPLELSLFINGVESNETVASDKPEWLSDEVWLDCCAVEAVLPCMRGLCHSLQEYSTEWQEYFQYPLVLVNTLPDDRFQEMTVFQKCLLWKICCPDKVYELCKALVLYELGGTCHEAGSYNLDHVMPTSNKHTPVIILSPANGNPYSEPTSDVVQYAKKTSMDGKVRLYACGVDSKLSELEHLLTTCIQHGHWLLIQNAHLISQWPANIISLFKNIIESKHQKPERKKVMCEDDETEADATHDNDVTSGSGFRVHEDFRLIITVCSTYGTLLPGIVIQNSVKMACEQSMNMKHDYSQTHQLASGMADKHAATETAITKYFAKGEDLVTIMSLLHSTLVHSGLYGDSAYICLPEWTQTDLQTAFMIIHNVMRRGLDHSFIKTLLTSLYTDHCLNLPDKAGIQELIESFILPPDQLNKISENTEGIQGLLKQLLVSNTMEKSLSYLSNVSCQTLGLPKSTQDHLIRKVSRELMETGKQVLGSRSLVVQSREVRFHKAMLLLQQIASILDDLPDLASTKADGFYPMEVFYHSEVSGWRQLLHTIQTDVKQLQAIAQGQTASTLYHELLVTAISQHRIPLSWVQTNSSLITWFSGINHRIKLLSAYIKAEGPVTYNLSTFLHPERFITCILQTHARKQFKDLSRLSLEIQVLTKEAVAESAQPVHGVYVQGLCLRNASFSSTSHSIVKTEYEYRDEDEHALLPLVWLKPIDLNISKPSIPPNSFLCPLYVDNDKMLLHIPMPCDKQHNLAYSRVHIVSKLP